MNRTMLAALGLVVVVTLGACVEDDASFYIEQNNFPDKGCTPSSKGDVLASGVLDVLTTVGLGYHMFPTVVNGMLSTTADNQPERNNLHMKRFEVTLEIGAELAVDPGALEFSVPLSGTIKAGEKTTFGPIQVIDDKLAADLGATLCSKSKATRPVVSVFLRAFADRSSETRESAEFVFPVTLCCGCLVDWRTSAPSKDDKDTYSNACGAPQDSRVTCYAGGGGYPICMQETGS